VKKTRQLKNLENEAGQLIEGVGKLQAHEDERRDHQIRAYVHGRLKQEMPA
jgi:hypothetical protein